MPVKKEGTQSIPIIEDSDLVLRLGALAPIYSGKKIDDKAPENRLLLYADNSWCKLPDYITPVLLNDKELDAYSNNKKYELRLAGEAENGTLEFELRVK